MILICLILRELGRLPVLRAVPGAAGARRRTRSRGVRDRAHRRHHPGVPLDARLRAADRRRDRGRGARPAAGQHRVSRERHVAALDPGRRRSRTSSSPAAPASSSSCTARTSSTDGPSASSSATPRCGRSTPARPHTRLAHLLVKPEPRSPPPPEPDAVPDRPVGLAEPDRVEPGGVEDRRRRGVPGRAHPRRAARAPPEGRAHRRRRVRDGEVAHLPRSRRLPLRRRWRSAARPA